MIFWTNYSFNLKCVERLDRAGGKKKKSSMCLRCLNTQFKKKKRRDLEMLVWIEPEYLIL